MMAKLWTLMRRLGGWLEDWPCAHGHHEWGLYRPGTSMWHRSCHYCNASDMTAFPSRAECDVRYYEEVYIKKHGALASAPGVTLDVDNTE